jgi:hypothetical protein
MVNGPGNSSVLHLECQENSEPRCRTDARQDPLKHEKVMLTDFRKSIAVLQGVALRPLIAVVCRRAPGGLCVTVARCAPQVSRCVAQNRTRTSALINRLLTA